MRSAPVNIKLDHTDRKILEILQSNAKITNAQLAKDISLSPAPTLERVKKLENSGIIKSYHASLDKAQNWFRGKYFRVGYFERSQ